MTQAQLTKKHWNESLISVALQITKIRIAQLCSDEIIVLFMLKKLLDVFSLKMLEFSGLIEYVRKLNFPVSKKK